MARDVSELTTVKDKDAFQMFLEITASLTGQELVLETISNAVGVSKPTVSSWIGILQTSGLIHLLKPYSETSAIKRNIKRPKLYFTDTGLACYLADIFDPKTLRSSYLGGPVMETYMVNEIIRSYPNNREAAGFFYYRDPANNEVDPIIQRNGRLHLIECKSGITYGSGDVKAFSRPDRSNFEIGISGLVCLTEKVYPIKKDVYAFPVTSI